MYYASVKYHDYWYSPLRSLLIIWIPEPSIGNTASSAPKFTTLQIITEPSIKKSAFWFLLRTFLLLLIDNYSSNLGCCLSCFFWLWYFLSNSLASRSFFGILVAILSVGNIIASVNNCLKWWMTFSLFACWKRSSWHVIISIHSSWWIWCPAKSISLSFCSGVRYCESWILKKSSAFVFLLFTFWPPWPPLLAKWKCTSCWIISSMIW